VWIPAIAIELWQLKWIFKMAEAAILDFFTTEIWRQRKSRLARIHLHTKFGEDISNGGRPPSWILVEVKSGSISVSGTSGLIPETNFVWIPAIAIELWRLKWISKMAAAAIVDFSEVKFEANGSRGRPVSTSTPNSVKISQRAAELRRFVFFKMSAGRHLGFWKKWNLDVFLFPGRRF